MTLNVNNVAVFFRGTAITNDGAITSTGTSARFDFANAGAAMSYSGAGTFGTLAAPFGGVGISSNSLFQVTLNAPIVTTRCNLFTGGFVNSGQMTLGNAGASTSVVQTGSAGLLTPGGSFDASPVHNQGTGGELVIYAQESVLRTTGFEINPTRSLNLLSVATTNNVAIAGGDLTLTSVAASPNNALTLTDGRLITGANNVILSDGTSVVTRTNGYVDGNFRKSYAAAGSKTFEVGTANGYSPVDANVTAAGAFPADFTASATQGVHPTLNPAVSLARYWTTIAPGVTADLTFHYLAVDVPGVWPGSASVYLWDGTTLNLFPGGAINTGPMTLTAPGASLRPADGMTPNAPLVPTRDFVAGEPAAPLAATSAVSRKVHGGFGPFDIPLPLSGSPGIECRGPGGGTNPYQVVVSFANPIASVNGHAVPVPGDATLTGTGSVSAITIVGSTVVVDLTGVATQQQIGLTLTNVSDGTSSGNIPVPMIVLVGDSAGTGNNSVNSGDIAFVKSKAGAAVIDGTNFRADIAVSGTINASDISLVKSKSGNQFP